jgi:hypothetical protein
MMEIFGPFEAMIGFRAWKIANGELVSIWREIPWRNRVICAECPYPWDHVAPDPTCSCGVYAHSRLPSRRAVSESVVIWGAVSMWGRRIAHEFEVRTQYARIELLASHSSTEESGEAGDRPPSQADHELYRIAVRLGINVTTFDRLKTISSSLARRR